MCCGRKINAYHESHSGVLQSQHYVSALRYNLAHGFPALAQGFPGDLVFLAQMRLS